MNVPNELSPRDFLRNSEFCPERANERFPHAQDIMLGGLFISHSGEDSAAIQEQIISPVIFAKLPADGYFMHSRRSGGQESYRLLVQAALHWCDKFMVVISERSMSNPWVMAEAEWALDNSRPILAVRLDCHEWKDFMVGLGHVCEPLTTVQVFDFRSNLKRVQKDLENALDALLARLPRRGRHAARPSLTNRANGI
jgi:TIR domain